MATADTHKNGQVVETISYHGTVWHGKSVSVVLPTFNEKDSIRVAIEEFLATGVVDEVVVVNNNAALGTSEEVARTAAREVYEPVQGYGAACQRGLREATGDYIILSEPDGTFSGQDVFKLLAYADDFEVVFGTRTTSSLIGEGANMGLFLKWGNWAVAKLLELLFDTTHFSDVGCTMRLVTRDALAKLQSGFSVQGSHFGPEMMLLAVERGLSYIEVPVHYRARVGESSVTGSRRKAFKLGLEMISMIVQHRLGASPADRATATIQAGVQAALYLAVAVQLGSGLVAVAHASFGRTAPSAVFGLPSFWLQMGLFVGIAGVGAVLVATLRFAAWRIVKLSEEPAIAQQADWRRRAATIGPLWLVAWLLAVGWPGEAVIQAVMSAFLAWVAAREVMSVRVASIGATLAVVWCLTSPIDGAMRYGSAAFLALAVALLVDRTAEPPEIATALMGFTASFLVSPIAAMTGVLVLASRLVHPSPIWGFRLRRVASPSAAGALLLPVAASISFNGLPSGGSIGERAIESWLAGGPVWAVVGYFGLLTLVYGWKERRSGRLALAAVGAATAGLILSVPGNLVAAIAFPPMVLGAAIVTESFWRQSGDRRA